MYSIHDRRWISYVVAIAAPTIALCLTLWLAPFLNTTVIAFFYLAIALTAWYGGIRPSIVAIVLSAIAIDYFFTPPLYQLTANPSTVIRSSVFGSIAYIIAQLNNNLRNSKRRVEQLNHQLQQENLEQLRMALAAARMGLWDWDIVTGNITWSPEHALLFGLTPEQFDGKYETFEACVHPDDRAALAHAVQQALQKHQIYRHEYRVIWADGSVHWLEGRGHGFYNDAGLQIRMAGTIMNIDQRKQIEAQRNQFAVQERLAVQAVQVAQERVSTILESISDAFVALDSQWCYTYVNQKAGQLFNRRPEDLVGKNIWDEFPEGVGQTFYHTYYRAVAEQQAIQLEEYYPPWDRWFENRIYPSPEGLAIFFQEITDRKKAEIEIRKLNAELEQRVIDRTAELQRSNELLNRFFDAATSANIGLAIHDRAFRFVRINQALAQLNGQPLEAHLNKTVDEILPELAPTISAYLEHVLTTGQPILNLEIASAVPSQPEVIRHWLLSYFPVLLAENRVEAVGVIVIEISDRKKAEATQARLAAIVESSEDAIISKNLDGIVLSWNASAERLFGYSTGEMIGRSIIQIIPDDLLEEEAQFLHHIRQGNSIEHYETLRRRKDGTLIDVSLTLSPLRDARGDIIGASKIARDVTKQRQLDRMKSEFISLVSHELRTPLTAIRGSLGLLLRGVYDQKPEKKHRMIEIATQQSDRLIRLVNDILDLQRLESGSVQLVMQTCDAAILIQQSIDTMAANADERQIRLISLASHLLIFASADAIIQTLTNLLSNAIKFSEPNSTIWLNVQQTTGEPGSIPVALFSIKDQGRGIPADKLESIFERFQQVDASDAREKGGTGLGLAICRKIVEQHHGQIWVESVLGEGSTFYFTLPLVSEAN
jgi:PAS domain S-box-containing protein